MHIECIKELWEHRQQFQRLQVTISSRTISPAPHIPRSFIGHQLSRGTWHASPLGPHVPLKNIHSCFHPSTPRAAFKVHSSTFIPKTVINSTPREEESSEKHHACSVSHPSRLLGSRLKHPIRGRAKRIVGNFTKQYRLDRLAWLDCDSLWSAGAQLHTTRVHVYWTVSVPFPSQCHFYTSFQCSTYRACNACKHFHAQYYAAGVQ